MCAAKFSSLKTVSYTHLDVYKRQADHLYREIRIENTLTDENGAKVRLKQGAEVEVTVEASPEGTTPK